MTWPRTTGRRAIHCRQWCCWRWISNSWYDELCCVMSNLASQPQWPMDHESTNEVGDLYLLLWKFLEEPPVLLRLQCHAIQRQQKDINAEMDIRDCMMRETAGDVGPHMATLGGCFNSIPKRLFKFGSRKNWPGLCPLVDREIISMARIWGKTVIITNHGKDNPISYQSTLSAKLYQLRGGGGRPQKSSIAARRTGDYINRGWARDYVNCGEVGGDHKNHQSHQG